MRGSRGDLPCAYARAVIHLPCAVHLPCAAAEESGARETARGCGGNGRGAAAHACQGAVAAAGTSAGGTSAAGALDAGWTLWMRQNRAPRLAVNAYIRCLISSRDYVYIVIYQFKYIYIVILKYCKSYYVNYTIIIVINKINIRIYSIDIGIFDINTTLDYLVSLCTSSTLRQAIYIHLNLGIIYLEP
jgi:hypothetical protein